MSLGKSSNRTGQTNTRDPWAPMVPHLKYAGEEARNIYESDLGKNYFPGQSITEYAPQFLKGLQAIEDRALAGDPTIDEARKQLVGLFQKNPFNNLQEFQNPYQSQIIDDITKRIEGGVNRQFGSAGRGGSLAHKQALTRGIGDAVQRANFEGYNQAGQRARQYVNSILSGVAPALSMGQQDYMDGRELMGVGAAHQQQEARRIADRMNRYNFSQQAPSQRLQQFYNLIASAGGLGGTTTGEGWSRGKEYGFDLNSILTAPLAGLGGASGRRLVVHWVRILWIGGTLMRVILVVAVRWEEGKDEYIP